MTGGQAKRALNRCFDEGVVVYSRHFREELVNDGLTMEDVLRVCRSGAISQPPERDLRSGMWKYRIEGLTVDRDGVVVVFAFQSDSSVMITVFRRTR